MDAIVIYAITRLFLAFIFLFMQIAISPLFLLYKDYRQNSCYRIMFAICLADIFQLLANGLFIFLGLLNLEFSEDFEMWGGAINAASWNILFFLQLLLALNRCSVVFKNCFLISIKEQELPWERRLFNFLLLLSFTFCVVIIVIFVGPNCRINFNTNKFYWTYSTKFAWTETTTLQFIPLSLLMIFGYLLPNDATLDMIAFLNVGSIIVCGVNPFLYLILNVQFRERFFLMFRCRREKKNKFIMTKPPKTNIARISPTVTNFNNCNIIKTRANSMPKKIIVILSEFSGYIEREEIHMRFNLGNINVAVFTNCNKAFSLSSIHIHNKNLRRF
ncbi:hypothetical protein Mgra_00007665 [Meloidogyne graminicola]|uniref:7TM_GPCR_Srx domain-containing protein n=1 Tax=Meloidogyne graminicola TaxID=189291 RepID=A0A8S9ZHX0_9BILA|nr:hypothetical protein Mgra_00007665 [Meloidogyne graminicola]